MDASNVAIVDSGIELETFSGLKAALSGLGIQRRQAFRVAVRLTVHVHEPKRMDCETVDISVLGVRFNRRLPYAPGAQIRFIVDVPARRGARRNQLELQGRVVRVQPGDTGIEFVDTTAHQKRAVRELISQHRRLLLSTRRAAQLQALRTEPA
jgi:hypothetical protein